MTHPQGVRVSLTDDETRRQSPSETSAFGRLCPDLPSWSPPGVSEAEIDRWFLDFARTEMVELPGKTPGEIAADQIIIDDLEARFASSIPAAYTYFAQFVDHDVTFDPSPLANGQSDPINDIPFRTPRLDLDNIYGQGPDAQPDLYDEADPAKMRIGRAVTADGAASGLRDLPRDAEGQALIGDARNDENAVVSQMHLAFLLAHNTLVDRARAHGVDDPFAMAQQRLRWLYQWIVWQDFVRRITVAEAYETALSRDRLPCGRTDWRLGFSELYNWKLDPFMPVEFAVAAYRFSHSMVRNSYQTNLPHRGFGNFAPIFDNDTSQGPDDLRGFRPMSEMNSIQWDWFLDMESSCGPFPQRARKIDTKLSNALAALYEGPEGDAANNLAYRNLKRSISFRLPSGGAMAA